MHLPKKQIKHTQPGTQIQNINLIQCEVEKRLTNPQQTNYCNCNICTANLEIKEKGKAFLRQSSSNMKVQITKMMEFLNLVSAVSSKVYMKLDIPEICFFQKGDPKKLYKSNNCGVHQIQLTATVRKNLINVFLDHKKTSVAPLKTQQSSLQFLTGPQKDTHIKNFSTIMPSFKHGEMVQMKPQTFIFHNDRNYVEDVNFSASRAQSQQICIMKSKQKGLQLINQKQLRQTLKSLLYLQHVDFIQTYIRPNDKQDQIFQANYSFLRDPDNQLMFSRSLTQVKMDINLINKFSKDYIPMQHLETYENLLKEIPQEYCLYQTYKMVHYMELTKDVKIQQIGTLWLKNQAEQLCFFGLSDFLWHQNQKLSVDVGEIQELKQIMTSQLTNFEQQLINAWQHMKSRKFKPEEKPEIDIIKESQLEQIKKQSVIRIKEKQQSFKRSKKPSIIDIQKSQKSYKS